MADQRTLRKRLDRMRGDRADAMRRQARQAAAMDLLEENGEVTASALDERLTATFVEPDDVTLSNMLASKTAASVEYEQREHDAAVDAKGRADERVEKCRARLAEAEEAAIAAGAAVDDTAARLELATDLAALAGGLGDASAAPVGESVTVATDGATTKGR